MSKRLKPENYKQVQALIRKSDETISEFYHDIIELVENYEFEISIAYMFSLIERTQNQTLYCAMVRLHRVNKDIALRAVESEHFTRKGYRQFFHDIAGKNIPDNISGLIADAEKVRDKLMHGKRVSEQEKRNAIADIVIYSEKFGSFVKKEVGFHPFGDLRGYGGRQERLEKSTSRLVARGLGFNGV